MKTRATKIRRKTHELNRVGCWTSYTVKVVTPIFGGGKEKGKPDKDLPIRARSIRGQLRYWWRFLNQNQYPDRTTLFREEARIWGDVNENDEDHCGQVRVRTRTESAPRVQPYNGEQDYALFVARKTDEDPTTNDIIKAPFSFELLIRLDDPALNLDRDIVPSLRWWATFGGIGGRTRRGAGCVVISDLPPVTGQEVKDHGGVLVTRTQDQTDNAMRAWNIAVSRLRNFRQGKNVARPPGKSKPGQRPGLGRTMWPEADSIRSAIQKEDRNPNRFTHHRPEHDAMGTFPRAAFGLPILTWFKDRNDPPSTTISPENADRLASPLILTAYPDDDQFIPAALCLPTNHLDHLTLELSVKSEGLISGPFRPRLTEQQAKDIPPIANHRPASATGVRSTYALDAFMHYFDKNP